MFGFSLLEVKLRAVRDDVSGIELWEKVTRYFFLCVVLSLDLVSWGSPRKTRVGGARYETNTILHAIKNYCYIRDR